MKYQLTNESSNSKNTAQTGKGDDIYFDLRLVQTLS